MRVDEGLKCQRLMFASGCVHALFDEVRVCLHFEARRVFCVETPHATRARRSCAPAAAPCSAAGSFPLEQVGNKMNKICYLANTYPTICDQRKKKKTKIGENPNFMSTDVGREGE